MGNDLNKIKEQVKIEIKQKINDTGDEELSFSKAELAVLFLPAVDVQRIIFEKSDKLTLPLLFKMFHFAKQKNKNAHCSMTDVFYSDPLLHAFELQAIIDKSSSKDVLKDLPLLGFVFSIKDYLAMKGSDSTWGYFENVGRKAPFTAPFLDFLKSKGGLLSCKGNLPQALFGIESTNNIFGACKNPYNLERISGGSSGGEAVSIALGLVNAGIGSDITGSVRNPAMYCGIYALKPTAGRFECRSDYGIYEDTSYHGRNPDPQFVIAPTLGPMGRSTKDLRVILKVMNEFNFKILDLPPISWDENVKKPKKVGFIPEFVSHFKLPVCCSRVFRESKEALKKAGFELVEVNLNHLIDDIAMTTYTSLSFDKMVPELLVGDGLIVDMPIESYNPTVEFFQTPVAAIRSLVNSSMASSRMKFLIRAFLNAKEVSNSILKQAQAKLINAVCSEFQKAGVEVALAFGLPPAPKHDSTENSFYPMFYTNVWNFLNLPTGALPVTLVREDEQFFESEIGDKIDLEMEHCMKDSKGMPLGVQLVGLPWKEELVLTVMESLEEVLSKSC